MNNYNKFLIGGGMKDHNLPLSSIDMILYFLLVQKAGSESSTILPMINKEYIKTKNTNYKLCVKSIKDTPDNKVNFEFIIHNSKVQNTPSFSQGKYSAIYELKNIYDIKDVTKYILRLFNRRPTYYMDETNPESNKLHMCEKKKMKEEYRLFSKYLINIYYYGVFNVLETGKARPSKMDYIITDMYNTDVTKLTLDQKYIFLRNNITMLLELRNNNCFLGDYKLSNIGWDDELNIILIDYDSDTIVTIDDRFIKQGKIMKKISHLSFPYTYIPKYISSNIKFKINKINDTEYIKYDKFSIGGLINIITQLDLPKNYIEIFKLNDENYDTILTYEKMLELI
jgi:galactitol-specific phosphotransferase system IIB component